MGLFSFVKKAFKSVTHVVGKVAHEAAKGVDKAAKVAGKAVSTVYGDAKSAVSWAAKTTAGLAKGGLDTLNQFRTPLLLLGAGGIAIAALIFMNSSTARRAATGGVVS